MKNHDFPIALSFHQKFLNGDKGGVKMNYHGILAGANLRNINVKYAEFVFMKFTGMDLSDSNMSYTNLKGSNFICTDLSRVNLECADLSPACVGSFFQGEGDPEMVFHTREQFFRTILRDAKVLDSDCRRANFECADLSNAIFLEQISRTRILMVHYCSEPI